MSFQVDITTNFVNGVNAYITINKNFLGSNKGIKMNN